MGCRDIRELMLVLRQPLCVIVQVFGTLVNVFSSQANGSIGLSPYMAMYPLN